MVKRGVRAELLIGSCSRGRVMGIYDRDYYRREGPSFLGSFSGGSVCKWLIVVNVVAFAIQLLAKNRWFDGMPVLGNFTANFDLRSGPLYGSNPQEFQHPAGPGVLQGQVWRLLSYAFLHDTNSLWHILFNMLFLWWFGRDVEDLYGPREFLAFYLTSATLGGVAYVLAQVAGVGKMLPCVGASGAVTAVLVLCALHFPNRVILLFFILPVPIWLLVVFMVAQDAFGLFSGNSGTTAVTVHLAGAAFAFLYHKRHWRLSDLLPGLSAWNRRRARPRLRVVRRDDDEPAPVTVPPPAPDVDEQLEAQMDAVLEKMSRHGKESLTEGERQILQRASEALRRRRT
jgi:membrane associated rhomboid family serine protease